MERLTKSGFNFTRDFIKRDIDTWTIAQCLNKLQEYEDLEEQGKLLKLPCAMGNTVYEINKMNGIISEFTVIGFSVSEYGIFVK